MASAAATLRSLERAFGTPLACHVIPEYQIVLCVSRRGDSKSSPTPEPRRCILPPGLSLEGGGWRLAISPRPAALPDAVLAAEANLIDGDSEAIVRAVSGPMSDAERLDGDAFRIGFDPASGEWTLTRGAPGLRTLYYRVERDREHRFAVATQLRALLPLWGRRPELDHVAVSRYLCNGFFCEPETPVAGIRSVLPNEVLRAVGPGTAWQANALVPRERVAPVGAPAEDGHAGVRRQLVRAIEGQTANGSDTACLLSGGVDSSAVAAVAAKLLGKRVHTYTLVFEDAEINEAKYASAVAQRLDTDHREVLLTQPDFEGSLDWMLGALDMPTTDGLNSLLITRTIAQAGHATALVGVGSDELFGGHECMQRVPRALAMLGAFNILPTPLRRGARAVIAKLSGSDVDPWLPSHGLRGKFLALLDGEHDPLAVYLLSRRVLLPGAVGRLKPGTPSGSYRSLPQRALERIPAALAAQPLAKQISHFEQLIYLRNQLLRDLQMVSVATGVDVQAPFVDPDLVALVSSLPPAEVFGGQRPKQFLIDTVSDVLPREAYERPKLGFVLPIGHWLGGLVTSRLQSLSSRREVLDCLGIDGRAMQTILADCAAARGRVFYTREWCLFILLDWCARNLLSGQEP